ncbi:MAG: VWA domain-containing protein, partial [Armatimonadota bacterium]
LDALDTAVVGDPGTALADAITAAVRGFRAAEHTYRHLVILSDGEDHRGGAVEAAREAARQGVTIHVVGLGSALGEPIPELDAQGRVVGHKRDRQGEVVLTRMDEKTLRAVAEAGGGIYVTAGDGTVPVARIFAELQRAEGRVVGTYQFTQYQERYQVPLGLALILIALHAVIAEARPRR